MGRHKILPSSQKVFVIPILHYIDYSAVKLMCIKH